MVTISAYNINDILPTQFLKNEVTPLPRRIGYVKSKVRWLNFKINFAILSAVRVSALLLAHPPLSEHS